jgi:hypothetical protein
VVKEVAAKARAQGVVVICNTLKYTGDTPETIAEGVQWLWDTGIRVFWVPYPTIVVQRFYERLIGLVDERVAGSAAGSIAKGSGN